jgi:GNAT superfamily N-acetyltransferase
MKGVVVDVKWAASESELLACYPVMSQLRTHLNRQAFVDQLKRQLSAGYQLVCLQRDGEVLAVAGFRITENLAWGKHLFVEDLVADKQQRSSGYGGILFDWLLQHAKENSCQQLHLDSGVQRFDAHRFYLNKRMNISSHHFSMVLR